MPTTELLWIVIVGTAFILGFAGFVIVVVVVNQRRLIASQNEKLRESMRVQELLREIPERILQGHEEERARVARELHDGINQMLAAIKYRLHSVHDRASGSDKGIQESLGHLTVDLERTMEEVKRISHNLHPKALDDLGFLPAIRSLCDDFSERTRIPIAHQLEATSVDLTNDVKLGFLRIIQEALQNIEKHAHATKVVLQVESQHGGHDALVSVIISDNGKGFEIAHTGKRERETQSHRGLGMTTMSERAALMGGSLRVESTPNSGTRIIVQAPVKALKEGQPH